MRILFYLPVVTDEWLTEIIRPLIETAATGAEVHVVVPAPWAGTGMSDVDLANHADIAGTTWHVMHDAGHSSLRTRPSDPEAVLRLVRKINPDYTFCRSADVETPGGFPGRTAFLMEADYAPIPPRRRVRLSGSNIFDHAVMPPLTPDQRHQLAAAMTPLRRAIDAVGFDAERRQQQFREAHNLPADRPVVALPLEHDGSDNFFTIHSPAPDNAIFAGAVARALGDRCTIAATLHPAQRGDENAVRAVRSAAGGTIHLLDGAGGRDVTPALVLGSGGLIVRDSKAFPWAALLGRHVFRVSRFANPSWLGVSPTLERFGRDVADGATPISDVDEALIWLGFHLADRAFIPAERHLDLGALIDRIEQPLDPRRWDVALERAASDIAAAATTTQSIGV